MDLLRSSASARLAVLVLAILVAYKAVNKFTLWQRRRAFQREKGTLPIRNLPQWERVFGMDYFLLSIDSLKNHRHLESQRKRFTSSGYNTISLVIRGHRVYSTIEPENLKVMQAVDFKKWELPSNRKYGFRTLLGAGIFTTDGYEWQHSRNMLRPNFVRSQVADIDMFEKHIKHVINAIPVDGSAIDLADLFFRLTIDSATEFLFGESTASLTRGSSDGFSSAFTSSQEHTMQRARWGRLARWFAPSESFHRDVDFVHRFVDSYVDKGLARRPQLMDKASSQQHAPANSPASSAEPERYIFIDELVRQTNDRVRIRSELLNILLAGRDTTASLLTNVWWQLARRRDVWAKLQAEVSTLQGAAPAFEQLKEMKYLRAVLNEALRLWPVVPLNSREAVEDTTLPLGGGRDGRAPIFVPKGQHMTWSTYAMHRRQDYFGPDAEHFRPERWLDDPVTGAKGLRPGWEYLPFNGGARICLGQQYALTEASYTTARLCQAFSGIESRDDRPWTEMITLTCVNRNGAVVALTPRE